jgi:hypothetical protein
MHRGIRLPYPDARAALARSAASSEFIGPEPMPVKKAEILRSQRLGMRRQQIRRLSAGKAGFGCSMTPCVPPYLPDGDERRSIDQLPLPSFSFS